jgi:hypothetical protein
MRTPLAFALALLLADASGCGSRPSPRGCQTALDCAVSDQCSGGVCAPLSCSTGLTPCSGACVNLASAPESCGTCGHDCGGGLCATGVCQPTVVRDGLVNPVFDLDDQRLYFSKDDKILSCPLDGCGALAPQQLAAVIATVNGGGLNGGFLLVGGGKFFFMADATSGTGGPWMHDCPLQGGCPTPPDNLAIGAHQSFSGAFALSGTDFYWGHYKDVHHADCSAAGACAGEETLYTVPTGLTGSAPAQLAADAVSVYFPDLVTPTTLDRCPRTGVCTPDPLATGLQPLAQLAVRGGKVWMLASGRDGFSDGTIKSCPAGAGPCTPALFANALPFPVSLAVDDNAVTWLDRDAVGGIGLPSDIFTCPATGCAGGPRLLAAGQTGAYGLRSNARFVYWATPTQILRVAK